jgi:PGF-pre-PGF domain-containing protein
VIGTGDDPAEDDETSTDATEDDQVERDGGGGGGLPWPSGPNIEAYMESMLFSVDAGEDRVLSIGSGTGVREVRFRAASKLPHAKFAVKRLKEHDLASAIKGRVYTILDIETTADVERADLIVSVNERWLRENDIEIDAIRVYRHDGSWKQLPTEPIATTPYGQIYKATTQSFSYFAIGTGQTAPPPNDTQSDDAPEDTGSDDGATVQPEDDQPSDAEQVPGNDAQPPRVERASDVSWWVYLAPLILFISLGGLGLLFMTEPDLGLDDAQLKKLRNYVDRNKHMPRDALKQKMLDKGWPEDVITYVLNDRL